jgi:hypothetical protein
MEIIEDIVSNREKIDSSIAKFGYAPEHNTDWFEYYTGDKQKAIFIWWPDESALFTHKDENEWYTFSEPIVPEELVAERIIEFAEYALTDNSIGKIVVELRAPARKQLLEKLPNNLRTSAITYTLNWPIMNMEKFDSALPGGHFKSIRNARSSFYRNNKVEVVDAKNVDKELLKKVAKTWSGLRNNNDKPYYNMYYHLIENEFRGATGHRAMIVNGKVVGFNAGWPIPNSEIFYASVGLHDFSVKDLGPMLYLEDLEWIKNAGYKTADMGGVEKGNPLNFKLQFQPESIYKTFVFSIVRK